MADSPPRSRRRPPTARAGAKEQPPKSEPTMPKGAPGLEAKLEQFLTAFALPFAAAGDEHCAGVIARGAPGMAEAWANLAKENANVRSVLLKMMEGSAWSGVIISTLGVAIPIASHHTNLSLPPIPGVTVPAGESGDSPTPAGDAAPVGTPPAPPRARRRRRTEADPTSPPAGTPNQEIPGAQPIQDPNAPPIVEDGVVTGAPGPAAISLPEGVNGNG